MSLTTNIFVIGNALQPTTPAACVWQIAQTRKEKKCQYATRVLEIEKVTFTSLVFKTTSGMGEECLRYHRRLAELLAMKKGEDYAKTTKWIRVKISFSLIRSALVSLRGSRSIRRKPYNIMDIDIDIQTAEGGIREGGGGGGGA